MDIPSSVTWTRIAAIGKGRIGTGTCSPLADTKGMTWFETEACVLDVALGFVRERLDAHLRRRLGLDDVAVVLNHLAGDPPEGTAKNRNRLIMTMVMLEHETSVGFHANASAATGSKAPAQRFNLHVLLAANFDDYLEGLKVLSEAILFFQATPSIHARLYPQMPEGLDALQFELENVSAKQLGELWGAFGVRYLPSIQYRMRHVTLDAGQIRRQPRPVNSVETEIRA
jgi:Pvc16 N-terminal domain